jgi:hypothetical protein
LASGVLGLFDLARGGAVEAVDLGGEQGTGANKVFAAPFGLPPVYAPWPQFTDGAAYGQMQIVSAYVVECDLHCVASCCTRHFSCIVRVVMLGRPAFFLDLPLALCGDGFNSIHGVILSVGDFWIT